MVSHAEYIEECLNSNFTTTESLLFDSALVFSFEGPGDDVAESIRIISSCGTLSRKTNHQMHQRIVQDLY